MSKTKQLVIIVFVVVLFLLIVIAAVYFFSNVIYCMDDSTAELLNRIANVRANCAYHLGQFNAYSEELTRLHNARGTIPVSEWNALFAEFTEGVRESQTNLNSERRMLSILERRLDSGNTNPLTVEPTVKKRGFEE